MTVRKPAKPNPRQDCKVSKKCTCGYDRAEYLADMRQINRNFTTIESWQKPHKEALQQFHDRIAALETRKQFRDAGHDEPVSNAAEAIGVTSDMMVKVPTKRGGWRWTWWRA